jgi:renalase
MIHLLPDSQPASLPAQLPAQLLAQLHIAVIGAGIAGLACAQALVAAGALVQVFEKSRGVSGRMSTRKGEGWQCDHGAQYFTAREPKFRAEVQRWINAGAAALWEPEVRVYDSAEADGFTSHAGSVDRFVGTPGMTAPGRLLAENLSVRCNATVDSLQRKNGRWLLHIAEGGLLETSFDIVLLAMPAPQAGVLLRAVETPLLETPLLAVTQEVRMRAAWALMLQLDAPLAADSSYRADAAFVNSGPLRWVARDTSKPVRTGKQTWLLHATPQWSETHLEAPREEVAADLLGAFADLGMVTASVEAIGSSTDWTLHRWLYADTENPLSRGCAWDAAAGLGLCGDWLLDGKVEGAWRSGRRLAEVVAGEF